MVVFQGKQRFFNFCLSMCRAVSRIYTQDQFIYQKKLAVLGRVLFEKSININYVLLLAL